MFYENFQQTFVPFGGEINVHVFFFFHRYISNDFIVHLHMRTTYVMAFVVVKCQSFEDWSSFSPPLLLKSTLKWIELLSKKKKRAKQIVPYVYSNKYDTRITYHRRYQMNICLTKWKRKYWITCLMMVVVMMSDFERFGFCTKLIEKWA